MVAASVGVGVLTWMIADSPVTIPPSGALTKSNRDLASFEPPPFPAEDLTVAATGAEPSFAAAMTYYRAADYSRASVALQQATSQQPDNPEIRFYLGVSYLLTDDTRAGIRELKVAERLGDSPYQDRIHFYLAKAFLKQKDTVNAVRELNTLVDTGGNLADTAKKLKSDVDNNVSY